MKVGFQAIFDKAMASGDLAEANKAMAHLAKYSGHEPVKKTEGKLDVKDNSEFSKTPTADLLKLIPSDE